MDTPEKRLETFMNENGVQAEQLFFSTSCRSVEGAAKVVNTTPSSFVKTICMIDSDNNLVVAIVGGEDRVSTSRVAKELGIQPLRMASPEEILAKTGYPVGGVPPFGFHATFLLDPKLMEREVVYAGGGSENSLMKITPEELRRANNGRIARVRR